jgi:Flp pilus assembly protein TadD/peroxiredoxin
LLLSCYPSVTVPVSRTQGMMPGSKNELISRRALLKSMGLAPLLLRPAPLFGASLLFGPPYALASRNPSFAFADTRLTPHYPEPSPLADILRMVAPGSDDYPTEKYAFEIELLLKEWGRDVKESIRNLSSLARLLDPAIEGTALGQARETRLRSSYGIEVVKRQFDAAVVSGRERFLQEIEAWLGHAAGVGTAEFEIYGIEQIAGSPLTVRVEIRYDIVASHNGDRHEERVGSWRTEWSRRDSGAWIARRWEAGEEVLSVAHGPVFIDITSQALGDTESYKEQLQHGADYWRTVLDSACGIDIYNNTGVATGDFDNDGFDDFYVCQPAGLPNRLYRNKGDGTFEDVSEKAGAAVLDNTACALFADFQNRGLQDLLVVCSTGPLLFLNQGDGTFSLKQNAFKFAHPPQGSFTHAAIADYDRDGRLDIYFCTYMYYLGLDQYHYPVPYYDARNGPPNCLFHNEGNGSFIETTEAAGLGTDNNRYSFACAWGDSNSNGLPDLFIANDFGTSQLYRNNGNGTFTVVSKQAHVEGVGAGMGCSWSDYDNDGHQDVYVPSMWEAAGQRVSEQKQFHAEAPESIRALYQRHARGNALYRNLGDGTFENVGHRAGVEMGRWSWSSDFWDFDHDGYPDLYVSNGYISSLDRDDLASFFWRQVVAKSPDDAMSSVAYERGWNAINELVRSDNTWHGYARNVMFVNNGDGSFAEISGPSGLDFSDDSRAFALADIDHDGRLEVILKNRNTPQLRILRNAMKELGHSITFRLQGTKSNRDAIGTSITVEAGSLCQTKYLQAGSGFLSQHSKELFFGLGSAASGIRATVRWPNGLVQQFENLPAGHSIEIEEGRSSFTAKPFATLPAAYGRPSPPLSPEPLPTQVETWLIEPLKAPAFSLPDLAGNPHELRQLQGSFVLLNFWEAESPLCRAQLRLLQEHHSALAANHLEVLAVNVDDADHLAAARTLAEQERFGFPVIFATQEVAGIYNILYRYLFDRRRNLAIPTSFLLDKDGRIIKVYQGELNPQSLLEDVRSAPANAAERMRRAIPFKGQLYQGAFQRNDFTYGVALFQHGYLDQAEESFQQVVAAKPDSAEGYYNLGTLSLRRGDFQQAQLYLEKTLKLRTDYPEAWNNLGMIAAQEGDPSDAVRNFQQAITLRPDYAIALLNLGNVYRRQQDFVKAEDCLRRALALEPDDPEINYSLGMLYAQQEQMQQAAQYLQKAIELKPAYPQALNNLGVLYVRAQDYANAEAQFKTCIRLVPEFDQSYLNLARVYAMQGEMEQARQVVQELLRIQPDNPAARQALEMFK